MHVLPFAVARPAVCNRRPRFSIEPLLPFDQLPDFPDNRVPGIPFVRIDRNLVAPQRPLDCILFRQQLVDGATEGMCESCGVLLIWRYATLPNLPETTLPEETASI